MQSDLVRESEIPFHFVKEGTPLIMLPVRLNNQGPFEFILDTGNVEALVITPTLAERLGIETEEREVETSFPVGLSKRFFVGTADSFELGGTRMDSVEIIAAPALEELAKNLQARVDGNVGYGALKDYAITLDFKTSTLTLSSGRPDGDAVPFEIGVDKPLIILKVLANGQPLAFALDTGASYCCISTEAANSLGLPFGKELAVNRSSEHKSYMCSLDSLSVGHREQQAVGIVAADFVHDLSEAMGRKIDGVLGHSFWSKYRLTIDYPNLRLLLDDQQ